jgi:hypothetical protein
LKADTKAFIKADILDNLSLIALDGQNQSPCPAGAVRNMPSLLEVDGIFDDSGNTDLSLANNNKLLAAASNVLMTEPERKTSLGRSGRTA